MAEGSLKEKLQANAENALSLFVAGFIGFLNFLGLNGAELDRILRGEPLATSLIALIAATAFIISLASVFAGANKTTKRVAHLAAYATAIALLLILLATPIPFSKSPGTSASTLSRIPIDTAITIILFAVLLVVGLAALRTWRSKDSDRRLGARTIAVVLSLALVAVAGLGALRLAERSQIRTSYPQLTADTSSAPPNGTITATGTATRLPAGGTLVLSLYAVPRSWPVEQMCTGKATNPFMPPCVDAPCTYLLTQTGNSLCQPLGYEIAQGDENGMASAEVRTTFSLTEFKRMDIRGFVCRPNPRDDGQRDGTSPEAGSPTQAGQSVASRSSGAGSPVITTVPLSQASRCEADDDVPDDPPKLAYLGIGFPDP